MNTSAIEWTDRTWNPVSGCSKVSQGCKHCYAERLWPKVAGAELKRTGGLAPREFTAVRCHPERLDQPLRIRKPERIFVNSMSDLFHEDVPDEFILHVFDIMRQCTNGWTPRLGDEKGKLVATHTFQILTKRAARMLDFCRRLRFSQNDNRGMYLAQQLPHNGLNPLTAMRNVWLGVSVEDQATADERIPLLLQTPAAVRFISAEPLLGAINLRRVHYASIDGAACHADALSGLIWSAELTGGASFDNTPGKLQWVIAGGESGPDARPSHPDWFRAMRDQCAAAGVPFFFKQWGEFIAGQPGDRWLPSDREPDHLWSDAGDFAAFRVGKKRAGRTLDGREHSEFPA